MFRSLVAAALALTVGFAAAPQQAKADDSDIVAGVIFGAILGGTIAVLADGGDKKDYRHSHRSDRRVYRSPPPRYYGHRSYDRRGYRHDRRDYRHDYRADRRHDRKVERRIDRKVERRLDRREDRRVERRVERREDRRVERRVDRRVERRVDRRDDRREDRYKQDRDRAGRSDPRVARDIANRRAFILSQNGRGTGNDNVGGGGN